MKKDLHLVVVVVVVVVGFQTKFLFSTLPWKHIPVLSTLCIGSLESLELLCAFL